MLVQKRKGYKLLLSKEESNELESYTLLHLNEIETNAFLKELGITEDSFENTIIVKYEPKSAVITLFTKFADEHKIYKNSFKSTLNSKYMYISNTPGGFKLKRYVDRHRIFLIHRESDWNDLNEICIDDEKVHQFCRDCMTGYHRKPNDKKWLSQELDGDMYKYWSDYMNDKYLRDKQSTINKTDH